MAIETPVEVLRRLREQARQERIAGVQQAGANVLRAKPGRERAFTVGKELAGAFAGGFQKAQEPTPEESEVYQQAVQRKKWLSVAPDDVPTIKSNIKAAADAGDYEVANYLTGLYFNAEKLQAEKAKATAAATPDAPKAASKVGKLQQDRDVALQQGRTQDAAELQKQIEIVQTGEEAGAQSKMLAHLDTDMMNAWGITKEDLDEEFAPQFQMASDSIRKRVDRYGEDAMDARKEVQKLISFEKGFWNDNLKLTDHANKLISKGKIKFANVGGVWEMVDVSGKQPRFVTEVDESLIPEPILKAYAGE